MKFLLFNVTVVVALAYLFLHAAPSPAVSPVAASAPREPTPVPTVEAVIDVPVVKTRPLREVQAAPASEPKPRPADRRKSLDQLIRDMELLAAKKLGQ